MAAPSTHEEGLFWTLFGVGALIGLGKLLVSEEKVSARKAFGHAIVSGGVGGAAALLQIPFPDAPVPVLIAGACALSSIGAPAITAMVQRYIEKK